MATTPSLVSQETADPAIVETVLEAIATQEDRSPVDLDQPLYDAIDPDALNTLFEGRSKSVSVQFTYLGYEVVVRSDDGVNVTVVDQQSA